MSGLKKVLRRVRVGYPWGPFPDLDSTPWPAEESAVWPLFYKHELTKIRQLVNMSYAFFSQTRSMRSKDVKHRCCCAEGSDTARKVCRLLTWDAKCVYRINRGWLHFDS